MRSTTAGSYRCDQGKARFNEVNKNSIGEVRMPPEEENIGVITYRLGAIENTINDVSESMRQLVILEQKHIETREALARAFQSISAHDQRITKIEVELPTLTLTRGWVISAVIGIVALVAVAIIRLPK